MSYYFYKILVPFEVKSPKLDLTVYEAIYSFNNLLNVLLKKNRVYVYSGHDQIVETKFGKFKIRTGTMDAAVASPAFERLDVNCLMKLIETLVDSGQRILFLDVGGDIGSYSIAVGNKFRDKNIEIACFEPIRENYNIIKQNLALNNLNDRVTLYNFGLGKANETLDLFFDKTSPGSSSLKREIVPNLSHSVKVEVKTLDSTQIATTTIEYNSLIMKIDVEGFEKEVLAGAINTLKRFNTVFLLVEDFVDPSINEFLRSTLNAVFIRKVTDYNSWWQINNNPGSASSG
jgi:FkbM family methyltransferase